MAKYHSNLKLDELVAIDVHTHANISGREPRDPCARPFDEALSIATHKPNTYIDLSGWSPKYFPQNLVQYTNSLLKDRVVFGSDYPALTPDRWLADFEKLAIKPEVRPLVLKENAIKLLKLRG